MFHFWFAKEIETALKSMKFVALNIDEFEKPKWAFLCSILQLTTVLVVEIANIWNLAQLDDILDLILNYIALSVISQFDSQFLEPFKMSEMQSFIGLVVPMTKFRTNKAVVSSEII